MREAGEGIEDKKEDAGAFVRLLLEAASQQQTPVYVLLTMRSDFLGQCSQFHGLPEALNEHQYLIPRMSRDEIRQAITGPALVGGAEMAPRLVQRLLNEVGDNQDQLPILQHALMRTWDEWRKNHQEQALDLADYEAIGGMAEALSRHAEDAFQALPDDRSREIAKRLFQTITEKQPDQPETRRPTVLEEICAIAGTNHEELIAVIDRFRAPECSFFMPPDTEELHSGSVIDISHESLIRQWSALRQWVTEESESRVIYGRVLDAARRFEAGQANLWRNPELQIAVEWWERTQPNVAWTAHGSAGANADAEREKLSFIRAGKFLRLSRLAREA